MGGDIVCDASAAIGARLACKYTGDIAIFWSVN